MATSITARALYDTHCKQLDLQWLAGHSGAQHAIQSEQHENNEHNDGAHGTSPIIGHLNLIHPFQIQVLGATELKYLLGLGKNSRQDAINQLFGHSTALVIIGESEPVPQDVRDAAERAGIPLFTSTLPSRKLVSYLQYYLTNALATQITLHGVFMEVTGIGVLLTGESGIGKSELALELVTRGHRLVADDAPEFYRVAPDTLNGVCPRALCNFLEVRGLGILNIRAMFGDSAIKQNKNLRLIVHLEMMDEQQMRNIDRLHGHRQRRLILGVEVPQVTLPVVPGLNLSVLVECAVRNHILYLQGYNAGVDFIERQQQHIVQDQQ